MAPILNRSNKSHVVRFCHATWITKVWKWVVARRLAH